jgi:hypothetical protein
MEIVQLSSRMFTRNTNCPMKKLIKVQETVDNHGTQEVYDTPEKIISLLDEMKDELWSDDFTFIMEDGDVMFIDDILHHTFQVGDQLVPVLGE